MERDPRNIYYTARRRAGLTQERWAESIGVCVESVRGYEAGTQIPSDEIVRAMAEVSGLTPLAYWHLCQKSALANDELPEVQRLPLPQAVVQLLVAMDDFGSANPELMRVASDGKISTEESGAWAQIRARLDGVIRAALQVRYADGGD